jgi:hypothetical protein
LGNSTLGGALAAATGVAPDAGSGALGAWAHAPTVMLANAPPNTSCKPARGLNGCAGFDLRGMLFFIFFSLLLSARVVCLSDPAGFSKALFSGCCFDESVA